MKRILVLFSICFLLLIPNVALSISSSDLERGRKNAFPSESECPPATTNPPVSTPAGPSFTVYTTQATGRNIKYTITYSINDAVVLVDENGNVINPTEFTSQSTKYTLKVVSQGEYYECGGYYDSPPITFGDKPVYYPAASPNYGRAAPDFSDSIYCQYSDVVVSDNGNKIATSPSNQMTEFSFNLDEGTHDLEIAKNIVCKYSFYSPGASTSSTARPTGRIGDSDGSRGRGYQSVYVVFSKNLAGQKITLNQGDSVTITGSGSPQPLTYSLNVVIPKIDIGTCDTGCNSGYVCCQGECMDMTKGLCRDINGDGLSEWVYF